MFERLEGYNEIIVITDTLPIQKKRKAVEQGIKHALKSMLPSEVKYRVLHQSSRAHYGLQIADYCNWAVYRKWDTNEMQFYALIKNAIQSEFEIFKNEMTRYY